MTTEKVKISVFKPYLMGNPGYKGGKTMDEVDSDKKIYKLSSNENLLGSSPKAVKALQESLKDLNQYPDRTPYRLQRALEKFYDGALTADHFIAGNAGSEVIEHIIRAFLGEGLECIVSNPCFSPYVMFAEWQGAVVRDVPLIEPDFSLDVDGILAAVNQNTRLVFLTSPNNPTGTYIPKAQIDSLLDQLPHHVMVVLDEVYYHFTDAADYTTALPYVKAGKNVIGINSFSKTYGLAALRIGYGYAAPEIAGYIRKLSKPFMINTLSMNAAIAALEDRDFVNETVELVREERNRLYRSLELLGVTYWPSQANFILIKPPIDDELFEERMLAEGIMVRRAGGFGAPGCVRVTIGTKEANDAYVQALEKVLS